MGDSRVAIQVTTKDCGSLDDVELGEMADMASSTAGWAVGVLGKQTEEWVLVSQATEKGQLRGFMFTTLERIGGTPALIVGMAAVGRGKSRSSVLRAMMHEQFHKALMAFPDEDVLVSARLNDPGPLEALSELDDVRPFPGVKANGEERAWGRRLSKRYGATSFDDRKMIARGESDPLVFDHESLKKLEGTDIFGDCDHEAGDYVVAWGWAMAEFLEKFTKPVG